MSRHHHSIRNHALQRVMNPQQMEEDKPKKASQDAARGQDDQVLQNQTFDGMYPASNKLYSTVQI